ncbi:Cms1p [Saccharomyces eubayanus]|uniref:Cms1p n=1 Tax=Saccharomyces eubayanus TaxID=1080349 RepID=UPI0006C1E72F|nr:CMS1-like protein [Saccharomyces eubayanus]KOG97717.1 CMS1-like protein [Saccharomyces eubayanus]
MSNPDDLDDGLVYDFDSQQEVEIEANGNDGLQKRPIQDDDEDEKEVKETSEGESERPMSKRQKKLQKKSKFIEKKKEESQYIVSQRKSIPTSSPEKIIEYLTALIREKNPDLSALELEELYFKKKDFLSTEKFDTERKLTDFSTFMQKFSVAPKKIVFSMSNIRVADVYRSLNGGKNCVKLFSKSKLKDDIATVERLLGDSSKKSKNSNDSFYFIATPTRMQKIIEETELLFQGKEKLDIILDASYLDPKDNTILSFENAVVLCQVLKTFLNKKSSVKILLY